MEELRIFERKQQILHEKSFHFPRRSSLSIPWSRGSKTIFDFFVDFLPKTDLHFLFEDEERQRSLASVRRAREREKKVNAGGGSEATKKIIREVTIPEVITVQELANRMATRSSEVIKINRYNGQIIWILGGPNNQFTITNDTYNGFSRQHDVRRLENGNLLLFDNGNDHEPAISRALEYELNEEEMIASLAWEFSHPEGYIGLAMGSVQRLPNNNTLINWGRLQEEIGVITEVDQYNNIVLEIKYSDPIYCYRVTKSNWQFDINMIIGDANLDDDLNIIDLISIIA